MALSIEILHTIFIYPHNTLYSRKEVVFLFHRRETEAQERPTDLPDIDLLKRSVAE